MRGRHAGSSDFREGRGVAPPPPRDRPTTPRRPRAAVLALGAPPQRSRRARPPHARRGRRHRRRRLRPHRRRRARPRGPGGVDLLPRRVRHLRGHRAVLHRVRVRSPSRGSVLRVRQHVLRRVRGLPVRVQPGVGADHLRRRGRQGMDQLRRHAVPSAAGRPARSHRGNAERVVACPTAAASRWTFPPRSSSRSSRACSSSA